MSNGHEPILENSLLRSFARQQLKGNWGKAILGIIVYMAISTLISMVPVLGAIVAFVIGGPMTLGLTKYFIQLKRGQNPNIEALFDGFKSFLAAFLLALLTGIFVFLWSLLFVIPGIIATLRYSMAFFILSDNPELTAMEALDRSKKMMIGYKGKLFMLYLSFIGWGFLCAFTFGIGVIFLVPYMQVSLSNFYDNLKNNQEPIIKKTNTTFEKTSYNREESSPVSDKEESNPLFRENPKIDL